MTPIPEAFRKELIQLTNGETLLPSKALVFLAEERGWLDTHCTNLALNSIEALPAVPLAAVRRKLQCALFAGVLKDLLQAGTD